MEIWTAHVSYKESDRVDITTRRTHVQGAAFAPDWETMVKPYRNGTLSKEVYTEMYMERMRKSYAQNRNSWLWLVDQPMVTLVCFCKPDEFCHRVILAKEILNIHFKDAQYMGERR